MNRIELKTLRLIQNHPAVAEVYHEQENGWWYHLKEGWINGECHGSVWREDTLVELRASLRFVRRRVEGDPL
jgi:hypothetical protein